ncbi:uncharacterized protein ndufv3 isoform X2 [Phycodurus eques]|uniref:uncharacterized protein ndufv3 isoform X2 n=1 Tax=Phycodurus eques TaxID=693459 RepID=UPI002ACDD6D0|nr:uncharacterized protein ndufv3 isoform X2 [Phycodurus eques]
MAISILRLRTSKCYQLENWGILRTCISALCTTQTGEATKRAEKRNDPDERATLLTYKTAVSFPMRVLNHGAFPTQPRDIAASLSITPAGRVMDVIANIEKAPTTQEAFSDSTPPLGTAVIITNTRIPVSDKAFSPATAPSYVATNKTPYSEPGDQPSAESTSSSSDSSDSDSEDDKIETWTSVQEVPEFPQNTQAKFLQVSCKENGHSNEANNEVLPEHEDTHASAALPAEVAHAEASKNTREVKNVSGVKDRMDSTPQFQHVSEDVSQIRETEIQDEAGSPLELIVCVTSPTVPVGVENTAIKAVTKVSSPEQDTTDAFLEVTEPVYAEVSANTIPLLVEDDSVLQGTVEALPRIVALPVDDTAPSGAITDVATMVSTSTQSAIELLDPWKGGQQTETPPEAAACLGSVKWGGDATQGLEAATMAPPDPEGTFENSTYRNYQHHSYTPYTFVDMDVEMAKYRLPQPTSGRHSPRH